MALRDEHRELTRRKVLAAVLDLVADGSLDELSVPTVARASGVSVATIYRYFPTKDELLAAAAAEPSRQALGGVEATDYAGFQRNVAGVLEEHGAAAPPDHFRRGARDA